MRVLLSIALTLGLSVVYGQQYIQFHVNSVVSAYELYEDDSIYFDAPHTNLYFSNDGSVFSFLVADIDSITFVKDLSQNVYVAYQNNTATVVNPLASQGVIVTVSGADVTVDAQAGTKDFNYILSGTSASGSFKIYSDNRFNILLDNLNLTNPVGPAINNQSKKKATIHLLSGTNSVLADGVTYNAAPEVSGVTEDQKATFFSESKVNVIGGGSLTIQSVGADQHALASDDEVVVNEGVITVSSAVKDAIHASDGYYMNGGSVILTSTGDGIDGDEGVVTLNCGSVQITSTSDDVKGIKADSTITMNGGDVQITLNGNQSKGVSGGENVIMNDGTLTVTASGNAVLETSGSGSDPAYVKLLTADGTIYINGGAMTLSGSGMGTKGISGSSRVEMNDGVVQVTCSGNGAAYTNSTGTADAYHSTCLKSDGNLSIYGGTITLNNSGSGGKGIDGDSLVVIGNGSDNPAVNITTTGSKITISSGGGTGGGPGGGGPGGGSSGDYDEAKAFKANGAVTINSGTIAIHSADDGIKSDASVTINNGDVTIANSTEGIEAPYITVNNGSVEIHASDDGFNATMGTTAGGTESNDGSMLKITGGYCYVSTTTGDGMDSNGNVQITGGTVVVHGPSSSPELGLDYNGNGVVTGGLVVISGPGQQMLQGFGTTSTQYSFILKTTSMIAANTLFHVEDASGNELFTFKPERNYETIVFSSPLITNGAQYKIYTTGSDSGTETNGLYSGGTYTPGTLKQTFTVSGIVTTVSF